MKPLVFVALTKLYFFFIVTVAAANEIKQQIYFNASNFALKIPKVIHQMWNDNPETIPVEMKRWKNDCISLNDDYLFKLYFDDDLIAVIREYYPEFLGLYASLNGVYQKDMARIVIIYHFGGIYMDLDFYCHSPFRCFNRILQEQKGDEDDIDTKNILVVSQESQLHAHVLRNKTRVVIQNFFMCTPKHPFLRWLLEDRLESYDRDRTTNRKISETPFSFGIEDDIDRYRASAKLKTDFISGIGATVRLSEAANVPFAMKRAGQRRTPGQFAKRNRSQKSVIIEVPEDVLHPLVDFASPFLEEECMKFSAKLIAGSLIEWLRQPGTAGNI